MLKQSFEPCNVWDLFNFSKL